MSKERVIGRSLLAVLQVYLRRHGGFGPPPFGHVHPKLNLFGVYVVSARRDGFGWTHVRIETYTGRGEKSTGDPGRCAPTVELVGSRDYVHIKSTNNIKNKNAPPPIPTHNQGKSSSPSSPPSSPSSSSPSSPGGGGGSIRPPGGHVSSQRSRHSINRSYPSWVMSNFVTPGRPGSPMKPCP
eukprot:scaffold1876_cov403-Pavlova_lutheri.AAC.1